MMIDGSSMQMMNDPDQYRYGENNLGGGLFQPA